MLIIYLWLENIIILLTVWVGVVRVYIQCYKGAGHLVPLSYSQVVLALAVMAL